MLSELQLRQVWEDMLTGEIRAKYYADLSYQYRSRRRMAGWNALILWFLAFLSWVVKTQLPWLPLGLVLVAAGFGVYSLVAHNKKDAAECDDLYSRWKKLVSDYQSLWERPQDANSAELLNKLDEQARELSEAGSRFPADRNLLHKMRDLPSPPPVPPTVARSAQPTGTEN